MKQSLILTIMSLTFLASSLCISTVHVGVMPPATSPAKSPATGPSNSDCSTIIYNMADCLSFISEGSNDTAPTKACCEGISSVIEFNPKCLCEGLESGRQMGFVLNDTRIVALPHLCKLTLAVPDCGINLKGPSSPNVSSPVAPTPSSSRSPSAGTPWKSASTPTGTAANAPAPSSGAGSFSVSVLFLVSVSLLSFA